MIRLGGITWLLTYNCNLACGHCFFDTGCAGPYLDPALVDAVLADCPGREAMYFQHLSGGEIFINEPGLFAVLQRMRRHWQGNIGLSTNGFWGDSDERAAAAVGRLADAGVNGISVSADWYHSQWLDPAAPRRVAEAVRRAGIGHHSWLMGARLPEGATGAKAINATAEELAGWDGQAAEGALPDSEAPAAGGFAAPSPAPASVAAFPARGLPAARATIRSIGKGARCNVPKKPGIPAGPCTELSHCLGERGPFNPAMVWIDPYGNVSICHGLVIGNLHSQSFASIINDYQPSNSEVTARLAAQGPRGLYELGLERGLALPEAYFDECDLCWTSRAALFRQARLAATAAGPDGALAGTLGPKECYPYEK